MQEYSTLQAMGLTDTNSISHYKLSSKDSQDVLKVYFKRSEGSAEADSSTFCFERGQVVAADTAAAATDQRNGGSDPVLMAAVDELNSLSKKQTNNDRCELLLDELDRLEKIMAAKIQELRSDLQKI